MFVPFFQKCEKWASHMILLRHVYIISYSHHVWYIRAILNEFIHFSDASNFFLFQKHNHFQRMFSVCCLSNAFPCSELLSGSWCKPWGLVSLLLFPELTDSISLTTLKWITWTVLDFDGSLQVFFSSPNIKEISNGKKF